LRGVGIDDPADIARRLNRRGFPLYGSSRWSTAAVRTITRQYAGEESACASNRSGLGSRSASE
jgi:hypothetical protein